ncbi:hypothetical protein HDU97_009633 [Phlyctochytrium planicorne]|nr:hypothetical protein HDU97_009633 [Phlyctochytrium planicorne]
MAQSTGGQDLLNLLADVAGNNDTQTQTNSNAQPTNPHFPTALSPATGLPSSNANPPASVSMSFDFSFVETYESSTQLPQTQPAPSTMNYASAGAPSNPAPFPNIPIVARPPLAVRPAPTPAPQLFMQNTPNLMHPTMRGMNVHPNIMPNPNTSPGRPLPNSFSPIPGAQAVRPSPGPSSPVPMQRQIEILLSKVPRDRKPDAVALLNQLSAKTIDVNTFLSRITLLYTQPPGIDAAASTSAGGSVFIKSEFPRPPTPLLKRPSESNVSPPDAKRPKPEPMMTRRASAQLSAPPLIQTEPNQQDLPGSALRLPPAWSSTATPVFQRGKEKEEVDVTKLDVASMMDVTSYAGVDMREEEENISFGFGQNHPPANPTGVDRSKLQDFMNLGKLRRIVEGVAVKYGILAVDDDFLLYLSLAAKERTLNLLEKMVTASKHRTGILLDDLLEESNQQLENKVINAPPDTVKFTVSVDNDVRKMMQITERMDWELDAKARKQYHPDGSGISAFEAARAAAIVAKADGTGNASTDLIASMKSFVPSDLPQSEGAGDLMNLDGSVASSKELLAAVMAGDKPKKKGKKPKAGVDTEAVKINKTNATLNKFLGGSSYSWMNADGGAGGASGKKKKKDKAEKAKASASNFAPGDPRAAEEEAALARLAKVGKYKDDKGKEVTLLRQMTVREMTRVTLRDALFCLEGEQQMAKSPILYKWLNKIN